MMSGGFDLDTDDLSFSSFSENSSSAPDGYGKHHHFADLDGFDEDPFSLMLGPPSSAPSLNGPRASIHVLIPTSASPSPTVHSQPLGSAPRQDPRIVFSAPEASLMPSPSPSPPPPPRTGTPATGTLSSSSLTSSSTSATSSSTAHSIASVSSGSGADFDATDLIRARSGSARGKRLSYRSVSPPVGPSGISPCATAGGPASASPPALGVPVSRPRSKASATRTNRRSIVAVADRERAGVTDLSALRLKNLREAVQRCSIATVGSLVATSPQLILDAQNSAASMEEMPIHMAAHLREDALLKIMLRVLSAPSFHNARSDQAAAISSIRPLLETTHSQLFASRMTFLAEMSVFLLPTPDIYENIPLGIALEAGAMGCIEIICNAASPSTLRQMLQYRSKRLYSPIHHLCVGSRSNKSSCLHLILRYLHRASISPPLNDISLSGDSPLHLASQAENAELVRVLVGLGADPNLLDRYGRTPFQRTTSLECMKLLAGARASTIPYDLSQYKNKLTPDSILFSLPGKEEPTYGMIQAIRQKQSALPYTLSKRSLAALLDISSDKNPAYLKGTIHVLHDFVSEGLGLERSSLEIKLFSRIMRFISSALQDSSLHIHELCKLFHILHRCFQLLPDFPAFEKWLQKNPKPAAELIHRMVALASTALFPSELYELALSSIMSLLNYFKLSSETSALTLKEVNFLGLLVALLQPPYIWREPLLVLCLQLFEYLVGLAQPLSVAADNARRFLTMLPVPSGGAATSFSSTPKFAATAIHHLLDNAVALALESISPHSPPLTLAVVASSPSSSIAPANSTAISQSRIQHQANVSQQITDLLNRFVDLFPSDPRLLNYLLQPFLDNPVLLKNALNIGSVRYKFFSFTKLIVRLLQLVQSRDFKNAILAVNGLRILQELASYDWPSSDKPEPWQQIALPINQPPVIDWSHILGSGSFGVVYAGQYMLPATGKMVPVAVKEIAVSANTNIVLLRRELVLHTLVAAPQVIQFYGTYAHQGKQYIVTERASQGDLLNYSHRNKGRLENFAKSTLLINAARSLQVLHGWKISHRDVKTNNFLVFDHHSVKITDFSISRVDSTPSHNTASTGILGTLAYLAPELLQPNNPQLPTMASDIYSFGFTIWEVAHEALAFADLSSASSAVKLIKTRQKNLLAGLPPLPFLDSNPWASVLHLCWQNNPPDRPNIAMLIAALQKIDRDIYERSRV